MKLSKKKLDEIDQISIVFDYLEKCGELWCHDPPEEWGRVEKRLYEMLNDIEMRVKAMVLKILSGTPTEKKKEPMPKPKASVCCWAGEGGRILEKAGYIKTGRRLTPETGKPTSSCSWTPKDSSKGR